MTKDVPLNCYRMTASLYFSGVDSLGILHLGHGGNLSLLHGPLGAGNTERPNDSVPITVLAGRFGDCRYPRQDANLRPPGTGRVLYPLSYGGLGETAGQPSSWQSGAGPSWCLSYILVSFGELQCYVLDNETRVLTQAGFLEALAAEARPPETAGSHAFMGCQPGSCALPHPMPDPEQPGCHWPYGNVFFGGIKPYRTGDPICMLTEAQHGAPRT